MNEVNMSQEKLNLKTAKRAILCGSNGSEPEWNPHMLGKTANQLLLFHFKLWSLATCSGDFAWKMTEKAESLLVFARFLLSSLRESRRRP
jgi:hypothetical protein